MTSSSPLRFRSLVVGLALSFLVPGSAMAEYTTEDRTRAIAAVATFLRDMNDEEGAKDWETGWNEGIYTFAHFKGKESDVQAKTGAGHAPIAFSYKMIDQIIRGTEVNPDLVADWAATFKHELVHVRQSPSGWTGSEDSYIVGGNHPYEAAGWGEGFASYWKWLKFTNTRYRNARTEDDRQKYGRQAVELATSFRQYYDNYRNKRLGPIPGHIEFEPLAGVDTFRLTFEEALQEAKRLEKSLSAKLHVAVGLSKYRYRLKAGESIDLDAHLKFGWPPYSYSWKPGTKKKPALTNSKYDRLERTATVSETITVTVSDARGQKASASCQVIVEGAGRVGSALPAIVPTRPTPAVSASAPAPRTGQAEYAWVFTSSRVNDWQSRLDVQNAATPAWKCGVSVSEGRVTIKNTNVNDRKSSSWAKNGMSESGTVTWSPPSGKSIRPGEVVSIDLTSVNAPRDHANFFGIISIKARVWRLGKNGARTGNPTSYFRDKSGREVLGYIPGKGNVTKALEKTTVFNKLAPGSAEGQLMSIEVAAQGGGQSVETEYVFEWKRL